MEQLAPFVPYLIWGSVIITGLGFALMLGFGLRNVLQGKINPLTGAILAIPAVLIGILYFVTGTWADAFILGVIILLVMTSLSLLISSFRVMFGL